MTRNQMLWRQIKRARNFSWHIGEIANNLDLFFFYEHRGDHDTAMYYHLQLLEVYDEYKKLTKEHMDFVIALNHLT